jgi:hypothetical protein
LPPRNYGLRHALFHEVNDPAGIFRPPALDSVGPDLLASLSSGSALRRHTLAATLAADPLWLFALDLLNGGWYREAHEVWEAVWNALGRTTPEARFVQGLIHLAAAAVKVREGKPAGVTRHTQRAREHLGGSRAAPVGGALAGLSSGHGESPVHAAATLWLAPRASPPWLPSWTPTSPNAGTLPRRLSCVSWPVSCGWPSKGQRGTGMRSPRARRGSPLERRRLWVGNRGRRSGWQATHPQAAELRLDRITGAPGQACSSPLLEALSKPVRTRSTVAASRNRPKSFPRRHLRPMRSIATQFLDDLSAFGHGTCDEYLFKKDVRFDLTQLTHFVSHKGLEPGKGAGR